MNTQMYIDNIMSFIYYYITCGVTDQNIVSERGGHFVKKNNVIRFKRFYDLIFID